MDLAMPGIGGFDAIARIRAHDSDARIVVISAETSDAAASRATELGAVAFVRKPFQPETVLDAVRKGLLVPRAPRC